MRSSQSGLFSPRWHVGNFAVATAAVWPLVLPRRANVLGRAFIVGSATAFRRMCARTHKHTHSPSHLWKRRWAFSFCVSNSFGKGASCVCPYNSEAFSALPVFPCATHRFIAGSDIPSDKPLPSFWRTRLRLHCGRLTFPVPFLYRVLMWSNGNVVLRNGISDIDFLQLVDNLPNGVLPVMQSCVPQLSSSSAQAWNKRTPGRYRKSKRNVG